MFLPQFSSSVLGVFSFSPDASLTSFGPACFRMIEFPRSCVLKISLILMFEEALKAPICFSVIHLFRLLEEQLLSDHDPPN